MKLAGKVVKVHQEDYTNKLTGQTAKLYRAYLQSGDPLAGALEVSLNEEQYAGIKLGDLISFVPSFSTRLWNRNTIVTAKVLEDLTVNP